MASYRIGIGSFNLKDGNIGIGTETTGFGNLKVEGTIKTTDLDVGISTFTRYSGFEAEQTNIIRDASYGSNESVTYTITVIGGIFYIDGVSAPILTLKRGTTYTFDQSADTNSNHPFRFKDGDGNSYSNGVTATGTAGSSGAKVTLVVASNAPDDLRYYCTVHGNGMGNTISVINRTPSNLETTGDIVVDTGKTLTVGSGATISVGSVECISVKHHFSVPVGDTAGRNKSSGYVEGTVRYNKDLGTMEFFNGNEWRQFRYQSDARRSPSNRGRAVIGGGNHSTDFTTDISYFSTVTQGNGINFGDLTQARRGLAAISSEIRGIWGGGRSPTERDTMDYVTIASAGNAIDFGDRLFAEYSMGGLSSSTRGIIFGGAPASDDIHYTTIATLGNEIDFGSLRVGRRYCSGFASPTRGVMGGGNPDYKSSMEYITIASVGNATDFGDLSQGRYGIQASSNTTRGVWMGGYHTSPVGSTNKVIDYNIIASTGNALNFGDLSKTRYYGSGTSNQTRGFAITGYTQPSNAVDSSIEYVTINSAGNAVDFGDVSMAKYLSAGCSDSHGGLGGY